MSYTPMSDLGQQGLFDITRTLLQQPDLCRLSARRFRNWSSVQRWPTARLLSYGRHKRSVRVILRRVKMVTPSIMKTKRCWRMARYAVFCLAPMRCTATLHEFSEKPGHSWPLAGWCLLDFYGHCCLLPLAADGRIFGGCEFIRNEDQPWSEKEYNRLQTFTQIVGVVAEQIQSRVSNNVDYDLLCRERDNFRILVAITNAVLSRLDIDELVSEVAKEIHHYFDIDAISIVLRSDRKNKLSIYSTHYLDEHHPAHERSGSGRSRHALWTGSSKVKRCCSLLT